MKTRCRRVIGFVLLVINLALDMLYQMQTTTQAFGMPSFKVFDSTIWQLIAVNILLVGIGLRILPSTSANGQEKVSKNYDDSDLSTRRNSIG